MSLQQKIGGPMRAREYPELAYVATTEHPYRASVSLNLFVVDQIAPGQPG